MMPFLDLSIVQLSPIITISRKSLNTRPLCDRTGFDLPRKPSPKKGHPQYPTHSDHISAYSLCGKALASGFESLELNKLTGVR